MNKPIEGHSKNDGELHTQVQEHFLDALRQGMSVEDVSRDLSKLSHQIVIQVLSAFACGPEGYTDTVSRFIAGCYETYPRLGMIIAQRLVERGDLQGAGRCFREALKRMDPRTPTVLDLTRGIEVAIELKDRPSTQHMIGMLMDLARVDAVALSEVVGTAYRLARNGQLNHAVAIWKEILQTMRDNPRVRSMHEKFLKEFSPDKNSDERAVNRHICRADRVARNGDIAAANLLWNELLDAVPETANAYLRFARKYDPLSQDSETSMLVQRAQRAAGTYRRSSKGTAPPSHCTIEGTSRTIRQWLALANRRVDEGKNHAAQGIWLALLRESNSFIQSIVAGFVRMARKLPPEKFLEEMRIPELVAGGRESGTLCRSIASGLAKIYPTLGEEVLLSALQVMPSDVGNRAGLAEMHMRRNDFEGAMRLWIPLQRGHARACVRCAESLADRGQMQYAKELLAVASAVAPEALICCAYERQMQGDLMSDVSHFVLPLLPSSSQTSVKYHQILAMKFLMRHGAESERIRGIVDALIRSGALTSDQAALIRSITPIGSEEARHRRDEEIDTYLEGAMPELRTSKFFKELSERKPQLKPGKKTSSTARAVIFDPHRP